MLSSQFALNLAAKLVIVLFAGGGGSCSGIEKHIRRHVDIAANHSATALSMHAANHPQTEHHIEDVRKLDPRKLTGARCVGYFHASPDCTHFSQAKGGQPRDKETRSLSWVVIKWAGQVRPEVITLENVKQIQDWGPLIAKRDKATKRVVKLDGTVAAKGEYVPLREQFLIPDKARKGQTWQRFKGLLRGMGYEVDDRVLCAADYGVPQRRNRLFMIAKCNGNAIVWPEPTHYEHPKKGQKRWVAAHTCIDFSRPTKSIFGRKRALAPATMRRVAIGLKRYVLDCADPFIVPITHTKSGDRAINIRNPLPVVTTAKGGEFMLATPVIVGAGGPIYSGKPKSANDPFGVITTENHRALVTAFLTKFNTGAVGQALTEPTPTVVAGGSPKRPSTGNTLGLVSASVATLRNNMVGSDVREPIDTVAASGTHHAVVEYKLSPEVEEGALRCAAFLIEYYGEGGQWSELRKPTNTLTTRARLALVTVWIKGEPYVVVDICLRMLTARELANATSFPPQYIITHGHDGRMFNTAQQVHMIGNAVPPDLQYAVTAANYSDEPWLPEMMLEAA
ncbi:MAG: DNA cytosine methyltransferase [Pseudomonadota bacterium]